MIYSYVRQITSVGSLSEQQEDIISYAVKKNLLIDKEVIEYSSVAHTIKKRKKFEDFIHTLNEKDIIITQSLCVLSAKIDEVIKVINCILSHKIDLHIVSNNILVNKDTTMIEIFPLLNNLNKEQQEKRIKIGRPKGSRSSSKFDIHRTEIIRLLKEKVNVSAIARELHVSRSSLKDYIESREIKKLLDKSWIEISDSLNSVGNLGHDVLLICPFKKNNNKKELQL